MRRLHEARPDLHRQAAAGGLPGRRIVVIAEPDAGDEIGGVADEPGVAIILAGSGLAGRRPAGDLRLPCGARDQRLAHHGVHHRDMARLDDLVALLGLAHVEQLAAQRLDPRHHMRCDGEAAIGERRVGADQFDDRHLGRAERDRGVGLEPGGDAEPVRGAHHVLRSDLEAEADRDRVQRHRQRLGQRHRAEIFVGVVLWAPALDLDRRVLPHRVGRQALLQRRQIHERLERGARLPPCGDRAVVLALRIVSAADHGADRAVGRHRHQRTLADVELHAFRGQLVDDGGFRHALQLRVDRGLDLDALVDLADQIVQHLADPVGDVVHGACADRLHVVGGVADRGLGLGVGDEFRIRHRRQHDLRPRLRAFGIAVGGEARGRFDETGQHRGFRDRHGPRRLAEISLRGGLDAIGTGAEIDAIEIELEDLVLGMLALQPDRELRLLQLALHGALLGQEQVLGELLRQRRAALRHAAMHHVGDERAQDADRVDAEM